MLDRLGNVIYWTGCGIAVIALLVVAAIVVSLISPQDSPQEANITLTQGTPIPSILDRVDPTGEYTWWKIKKGVIEVETLGIVEIESDVPNEAEQQAILNFLHEQHAPQIMEIRQQKLKRGRQTSYLLIALFSGIAGIFWLLGRVFRYVLAGK